MSIARFSLYAIAAASLLAACSGARTIPPVTQGTSTNELEVNAYATTVYKAVLLPTGFVPTAIMKDGRIPGSINGRAAVYRAGTLTILGRYNGAPTYVTSVNSFGDAVGYATISTTTYPNYRPVEYTNGSFVALRSVTNCPAYRDYDLLVIDDVRDIYGACLPIDQSNVPYIVRYKPGTPSLVIGDFNRGYGLAINASGTFVYSAAPFSTEGMAVSGTGLNVTPLPISGYTYTTAVSINKVGTIVGVLSNYDTHTPMYAYIFPKGGPLKVLPLRFNATNMQPWGINDSAAVIGDWSNSTTSSHGIFLYKAGVFSNITFPITADEHVPGFANSGSFVLRAGTQYYLLKPPVTV